MSHTVLNLKKYAADSQHIATEIIIIIANLLNTVLNKFLHK